MAYRARKATFNLARFSAPQVLIMHNTKILEIRNCLESLITLSTEKATMFFKTGKGEYAQHDTFMGVTVPNLRKIAKQFCNLAFCDLQILLFSKINEERLLALIILTNQFKNSSHLHQKEIYNFYLQNIKCVNNWNLVDSSAHLIMGAYLWDKYEDKKILLKLAQSNIMWERRIAIVATWYFIRNNSLDWTFEIVELVLDDEHDLIHKAAGWMLREVGKKEPKALVTFLSKYATIMPRTMLRYAIERFSDVERKRYLLGRRLKKGLKFI